jgi:AcrR family transcriptional regulator
MIYDSLSYCEVTILPTTTFLNLPAEKREKFLRAAREEFSRVPFADASINRIIRAAGIPRGSFYMYFKDKKELLFYLLGGYSLHLTELMKTALTEKHGDLFEALLFFYDAVRSEYSSDRRDNEFRPFFAILRLNSGLHAQIFQPEVRPRAMMEQLFPLIDSSLLNLRSERDLRDIFATLSGITGTALFNALQNADPAGARAHYVNVLSILKRGMAADSSQEKGAVAWTISN